MSDTSICVLCLIALATRIAASVFLFLSLSSDDVHFVKMSFCFYVVALAVFAPADRWMRRDE